MGKVRLRKARPFHTENSLKTEVLPPKSGLPHRIKAVPPFRLGVLSPLLVSGDQVSFLTTPPSPLKLTGTGGNEVQPHHPASLRHRRGSCCGRSSAQACLVLAAPADAGGLVTAPSPAPTLAPASRLTELSTSKPAASEMRRQYLRWQLVGLVRQTPGPLCVSPGTSVSLDLSGSSGHQGPGGWLWVSMSWLKEH